MQHIALIAHSCRAWRNRSRVTCCPSLCISVQVADPVTATTAVAVQVAQAAHAVHQQAASLHAAAEVHAQKAHEATSQVQSLQATAQVIAKTHEELVKKIEDVKQTAVAQIQQPVVSVSFIHCPCDIVPPLAVLVVPVMPFMSSAQLLGGSFWY